MANKNAQLAGYADANGDLGRPVSSGLIMVPGQVWLEGEAIHWSLGEHTKFREPSRGMMNDFLALHQATSPDAILRFAQEWGVLALAEGMPRLPCAEGKFEGAEPIDAWKYYSRRAAAVILIAAALKEGKLGDLADWGTISVLESGDEVTNKESLRYAFDRHTYGLGFSVGLPKAGSRWSAVDAGRFLIAREAGNWLSFWKASRMHGLSDFSLSWSADAGKWELQIEYHGFLFAAIALQLMLMVANADALYICSGCSLPYIRTKKRPKMGWSNYCDKCIENGVAEKKASRKVNKKRREAKRLAAKGLPLAEIAARVESDPETVKGWVAQMKKGKRDVKKEGAEARQTGKQRRFDLPDR